MLVKCPKCHQQLRISSDEHLDMEKLAVKCPACGAAFRIRVPQKRRQSSAKQRCPNCGASLDKEAIICAACGVNIKTGAIGFSPDTPVFEKRGHDWVGTLGLFFPKVWRLMVIAMVVFAVTALINFGGNLFRRQGFVQELSQRHTVSDRETREFFIQLPNRVARCAADSSIEVLRDENADWVFTIEGVNENADFSCKPDRRDVDLNYDVVTRQKLLGCILLPPKPVHIRQRLNVDLVSRLSAGTEVTYSSSSVPGASKKEHIVNFNSPR